MANGNKNISTDEWQAKCKQLEFAVSDLQAKLQQAQDGWSSALRNIAYLLEVPDAESEKYLQELKAGLRDRAELTVIAATVARLADAVDARQRESADVPEAAAPTGIISKLFGGNKGLGERIQHRQQAVTDAEARLKEMLVRIVDGIQSAAHDSLLFDALRKRIAVATETEFERLLPELIDAIKHQKQDEESVTVASVGAEPSYNSIFLQFIEKLSLPAELQHQASLIKEKLYKSADDAEIDMPLRAAVTLVTDMRASLEKEKSEFQNFLINLTEKLHDLENGLLGTQSNYQHFNALGDDLEKKVQVQVKDIEVSVAGADDLDGLKTVVKNQLDNLRGSLDSYRKNDLDKQTSMATELSRLRDKLDSVEMDADRLRTSLKEKHRQAVMDPLTGIFNRLAFDQRVEREYARWKRYKTPLSLVIADIDLFKKINDTFGHIAGDNALRYVAKLLLDTLRETDFVGRYGGEEFVILLPEGNKEGIMIVAEKIRKLVESSRFHSDGKTVPITISLGAAQFRDGDNAEDVFKRADAALYLAKQSGRNQCRHEDDLADK